MKWHRCVSVMAALVLTFGTAAQADVITHDGTTINMDFVTVGNAGNTADDTGFGAVGYDYRIGKYEVTADQWAAVIAADSNVGHEGDWDYSQPTAGTSWYEAAKFSNWLTTGSAESGVYSFEGSILNPTGVTIDRTLAQRKYGTIYHLPTEDEWYKVAYYDGDSGVYYDYPTGSDSIPTAVASGEDPYTAVYGQTSDQGPAAVDNAGGLSPYGTMGQGGNVWEWNETAIGSSRGLRGGCWYDDSDALPASSRLSYVPSDEYSLNFIGFRVATVPEPGSITLMLCGALAGLLLWRRRK